MTFALTKIRAYGIEAEEAVSKRYKQTLILNITGANTDVDLDIGDYSGTFWTAVGGTEPGITALKAVKDIQVAADSYLGLGATSMAGLVQADASQPVISTLNSSASTGGAVGETLTVTGLLTTDTILGVSQYVVGANASALSGWGGANGVCSVNDQLPVTFTVNPGAGAKVRVVISRTSTAVAAGTYQVAMDSTNTQLPNILFVSGNAPTSYVLQLQWILKDQQMPIQAVATA